MLNRDSKVHLALLTVSLIYGATFTMAKEVMPAYLLPNGFILLRIAVACVLFLVIGMLFLREKVTWRDMPSLAISAFFGAALNMLLFFKGLSLTTPINGAVLMLVTPVFVLILSAVIGKEKLGALRISGCLMAAAGAILLMSGGSFRFSQETLEGDMYIILNAISYAIYLVYARKLMIRFHPLTVSMWNFIFGLLFVMPFGWKELQAVDWQGFTGRIWAFVVFITVGTTFLTYLLNAWALRYASSSVVGSYIYLQPVFATVIALVSGRDFLSVQKMLFILLIFAGVYLVSKKARNGN